MTNRRQEEGWGPLTGDAGCAGHRIASHWGRAMPERGGNREAREGHPLQGHHSRGGWQLLSRCWMRRDAACRMLCRGASLPLLLPFAQSSSSSLAPSSSVKASASSSRAASLLPSCACSTPAAPAAPPAAPPPAPPPILCCACACAFSL